MRRLLLLTVLTGASVAHLTLPANRLDRTLALRQELGDHYWPSFPLHKFGDDVTASVCVGQSLITRYSREQWSMQMWDASGTTLAGTRAGAHQARGHQDLCTKVEKEMTGTIAQELKALVHRPDHLQDIMERLSPVALNVTSPAIRGRYCIVTMRGKNDAVMFSSGSSELLASLSNHNTPNYATCVPDTCSEKTLQTWFQRLEGKGSVVHVKCTTSHTVFNSHMKFLYHKDTSDIRFNLTNITNVPSLLFSRVEDKPLTLCAILFCVFALAVLLAALAATSVEVFLLSDPHHTQGVHRPHQEHTDLQIKETSGLTDLTHCPVYGWGILQCFSIPRNWHKIFPSRRSSKEIPVIDGLRCVCMFWVIIAHRFMLMLITSSYPEDLLQNRNNPNYWWLFNPYPSVDVFFVISGFLLSLTPIPRVSMKSLLSNYVLRYLRLCPAVMVTIWGVYSVLGHLGSGPIWDNLYYNFFGRTCQKSWLSSVLLMSNMNHPNDMCLGHLWSLSVDWQLSMVGLLVLMPLYTEGTLVKRYSPLVIAAVASFILPGVFTLSYNLPVLPSMASVKKSLDFYNYYYVNTLCRASPYFVGVLGGRAHLYFIKNPELLTKKFIDLGRAISLLILSAVMVVPMCIAKSDVIVSTLHNTVAKPCFAIAVLFLIITSFHGQGGMLGWLLSRSFVGGLARSSYCIYLVSLPIQVWSAATDSTIPSQGIIQIYSCCGDIILSIVGGVILTLLVELPAAQLLGYSLKSKSKAKKCPEASKLLKAEDKVAHTFQGEESHIHRKKN